MSKNAIDVSNMTLENGVYVDYSELFKGKLNANPKETKTGYKCYDAVTHRFVGLVDENKIACWYVSEKSCTKPNVLTIDFAHWYVGNIYAPKNKTKIGKEVVRGFLVVENSEKESVKLMTPTGEVKEVLDPVVLQAADISTASDIADDSVMYVSTYNINGYPIVGYKIFGRRSGSYKGIMDLNGEYFNIEEDRLRKFAGPCELAIGYVKK